MPTASKEGNRKLAAALLVGLTLLASAPVVSAASNAQAEAIARNYLQNNQRKFGLVASDVSDVTVGSIVPGTAAGMRHVYLQQRLRGIPVWNGMITVNVLGNGTVLNPGSRFIGNLVVKAGAQAASKTSVQAVQSAANFLNLKLKQPIRALSSKGGASKRITLSTGGIAAKPIEAELVWFYAADVRKLRLAWRVQLDEVGGRHDWNAFIDASTGEPLAAKDRIVHESAGAIAASTAHAGVLALPLMGALVPASPTLAAPFPSIDGASYTVFPLPYESPSDGGRVAVSGAANPAASPYGWHDTNGAAGAEWTMTRGNNVYAYADADNTDSADIGSSPDGGAGLVFNFPYSPNLAPGQSRDAAVTSLFYWTNIVHDIAYNYGFTEASGNFQSNNYGKGGSEADEVRAEAQDGAGVDNANFSTPPDGERPRMQMYQWEFPFPNAVTVTSPAAIAGNYIATDAAFGPALSAGAKTGTLVLANDGSGATSDACEPLVGFPSGAVALLDRGTCTFVVKVKNAQNAGAIAVVGVNNVAGDPISMGGSDATITIPAVMISQADGSRIKTGLPAAVTVQGNPNLPVNRDADFDSGVMAHEYGHGISNRLTGGPATTSCLDNAEQMGEGWSDWFASTLTARASDTALTRRGTATYLNFQGITATGIRPTAYSTQLAVNPSTYASVANTAGISSPHGIGYVWNTMLWEVYWNLVHRHGYNPNLYAAWNTGGNNLGMQLVMDGMKMQACTPGFVDGRDAIIAADVALTGGANKCEIWRGFAKRGLGAGAAQGSSADRSDGTESFTLPAACTVATGSFQSPVNPSAVNHVGYGRIFLLQFTATGLPGALQIDTQAVDCRTLQPTGGVPQPLKSTAGLIQTGNSYQLNWIPSKTWTGTCRAVTLRIPAATDPVAYFRFDEATPGKVSGR